MTDNPLQNEYNLSTLASTQAELAATQAELAVSQRERAEVQVQLEKSQANLMSANKDIARLQDVVESAKQWQKSWFKRIFHRWRPPAKLKRLLNSEASVSRPAAHSKATASQPAYNESAQLVQKSGLFDSQWYLAQYGSQIGKEDPLLHYLREGASLGFNPSTKFNTRGYLDLYPDIAAAKANPLTHYIRAGKREGRIPDVPSFKDIIDAILARCAARSAYLNPSKKTVLLVTHEMSRSGAPILVLNIAKSLRAHFNTIMLTLKPGGMVEEFTEGCDVLIGSEIPREHAYSERVFSLLFPRLLAEYPIEFALVNSIVSFVVLKGLWENDIPAIHLIHEFISSSQPLGRFRHSAIYSSLPVFSAGIVRENAILKCPPFADRSIILPQGRVSAPGQAADPGLAQKEKEKIRKTFRPAGFPKETVVIVGIGNIEMRKGLDLFVSAAKRVVELQPKMPFRFVWIGHLFDSQQDGGYFGYIEDQIQRSGLEDVLEVMDGVAEIEEAYQQSDILFLSSRLDPLPLVSLDSMAHGKPVVCFNHATGIAEHLAEDTDAVFGVIPYLDVEEAAQRICRLINDADHRRKVGEGCRKLIATRFRFEDYVERLECLGAEQAARKAVERADRELIRASQLIQPEFFCPQAEGPEREINDADLRRYMCNWHSGIEALKPFPGFHPGIYAERNGIKDRDPLAHYIEAGQPDGPWRYELIEGGRGELPASGQEAERIALHLHIYYPDVAERIFERFKKVSTTMDVLISLPSAELAHKVEKIVAPMIRGKLEIRVVPNRGRDIGPLLTEFGQELLANYDIFGHIHTKKSVHWHDRAFIERWADYLYENLLGGRYPMADTILARMAADKTLGLVFPEDPNGVSWDENREHAVSLVKRLQLSGELPKKWISFPVGTMFWARTAALRPLLELGLKWDDYPPEPLPIDGSMLHALERLLPYVTEHSGFRNASTYIKGISR